MKDQDTIAALATAPAPAGIAIVRVSGPDSLKCLNKTFKSKENPEDSPQKLIFGKFINPESHSVIDTGMAVFMPGPATYTGEDTAELNLHGNPLIVREILNVLYNQCNIRPAEAGEFTKRAFLNGKLDLLQAESVCDLISARSDKALVLAREQLAGKLSSVIEDLGEPLRDITAELEASLDFPEEDIETARTEEIQNTLRKAVEDIRILTDSWSSGHLVKEGFRVLIAGPPNAGKSSLLNALLETERAIVTDISGTTRDLIEESCIIENYQFVFCDSAGITRTQNRVEKIGIELAKDKIPWADLILFIVDIREEEKWQESFDELNLQGKATWLVGNKCDLDKSDSHHHFEHVDKSFSISIKTEEGLKTLKKTLVEEIENRIPSEESSLITSSRHYNALLSAETALQKALQAFNEGLPMEIPAAEMRLTLRALEEIIGVTTTDDILNRIFEKFCIGK